MNRQELKHILSSRFDFEQWKELLGQMFPKVDFLSKPIELDANLVKNGGQVGTIRLNDGRALGLFKFEVADNIIIAPPSSSVLKTSSCAPRKPTAHASATGKWT